MNSSREAICQHPIHPDLASYRRLHAAGIREMLLHIDNDPAQFVLTLRWSLLDLRRCSSDGCRGDGCPR
jgi:hypothetical protein